MSFQVCHLAHHTLVRWLISISNVVLALNLCGCAKPKPVDHEELQSKLKATISLASEGESFVAHVVQHRPLDSFFRAHLEYLAKQGRRTLEELEKATAAEQDRELLNVERMHAARVVTILEQMQNVSPNDPVLRKKQQDLAAVRNELQKVMP